MSFCFVCGRCSDRRLVPQRHTTSPLLVSRLQLKLPLRVYVFATCVIHYCSIDDLLSRLMVSTSRMCGALLLFPFLSCELSCPCGRGSSPRALLAALADTNYCHTVGRSLGHSLVPRCQLASLPSSSICLCRVCDSMMSPHVHLMMFAW